MKIDESVKPRWSKSDMPDLSGHLAVVTGATAGGLGYETALGLAQARAEVIIAGRSEAKGTEAIAAIEAAAPKALVRFEPLDLADLRSVADCTARIARTGKPLDILVNNAAVMATPARQLTAQGLELQFGTNHLGHFAFTAHLLPLLLRSAAPRVTTVASMAHNYTPIRFDNLNSEQKYVPFTAYCQSKLANMLFALELQRRSDQNGWRILSDAAHPGYSRTNLIANGPGTKSFMARGAALLGVFFSQSAAEGALPTLYAASAADARPGGYYGPDGFQGMKGNVTAAKIHPRAQDQETARRLWDISEKMTGVKWPAASEVHSMAVAAQ